MDIGLRIKSLRTERDMTLEELGNKVGVGKSTVRKWENGMIANMRRDKIAVLANALNCSPAYLMGWTDDPLPNSVLCAGGKLPEADIKYHEAVAYTIRKLEELATLKDAQNLNHLVQLYDRLDDIDKGKIIERMETMLEGEKYRKDTAAGTA
ncbi:MAG: helix-turn-helix domain-containing protein [Lachnospiraceae bacterium]|nr:helix-turn-helix domain-containing protein [Lachnospiraceae bacterium]